MIRTNTKVFLNGRVIAVKSACIRYAGLHEQIEILKGVTKGMAGFADGGKSLGTQEFKAADGCRLFVEVKAFREGK